MSFSPILAFLLPYVQKLFSKFANTLWVEVWNEIILAVKAAERKWRDSGSGEARKPEVVAAVMAFISSRAKLNFIQAMLVKLFINTVVDAIIDTVNEELGHDWVKRVEEVEDAIAKKLPIID